MCGREPREGGTEEGEAGQVTLRTVRRPRGPDSGAGVWYAGLSAARRPTPGFTAHDLRVLYPGSRRGQRGHNGGRGRAAHWDNWGLGTV